MSYYQHVEPPRKKRFITEHVDAKYRGRYSGTNQITMGTTKVAQDSN